MLRSIFLKCAVGKFSWKVRLRAQVETVGQTAVLLNCIQIPKSVQWRNWIAPSYNILQTWWTTTFTCTQMMVKLGCTYMMPYWFNNFHLLCSADNVSMPWFFFFLPVASSWWEPRHKEVLNKITGYNMFRWLRSLSQIAEPALTAGIFLHSPLHFVYRAMQ